MLRLRRMCVYNLVKIKPLYNVYLIGQALKWSDYILHFGHHLHHDLSNDTDVNKKW